MGIAKIQPSRVRRLFNGWCHGCFAGQRFERVLNLGSGHDQDRQGYCYSGYFDAVQVVRLDPETVTTYPPEEQLLNGGERYKHPQQVTGKAEELPFAGDTFDMVFCNWVIYHCDIERAMDEICRVLVPGGKLLVTWMGSHDEVRAAVDRRFERISYCWLKMDAHLDGRDWLAEGIWGQKR